MGVSENNILQTYFEPKNSPAPNPPAPYALLETSATVSFSELVLGEVSFAFSTSFTRLFLECSAKTYISFLGASASLQLLIESRSMFS